MGTWLAERGCAVHSWDQRGHGLSGGRRNFARDVDEYVDDLEAFVGLLTSEQAELPRVLVGHSMGGLVAARFLTARSERSREFSCAVLSGAALEVPRNLSRGKRLVVRLLARVWPTLRTSSGIPTSGLSRDPQVCALYDSDALVDTDMSLSLAAAMLRAQPLVSSAASQVAIPLLGLHGAADPICPASGTERFLASVPTAGSRCRVYPGLRHEIFNEPEREQIYQELLAWADEVERARA